MGWAGKLYFLLITTGCMVNMWSRSYWISSADRTCVCVKQFHLVAEAVRNADATLLQKLFIFGFTSLGKAPTKNASMETTDWGTSITNDVILYHQCKILCVLLICFCLALWYLSSWKIKNIKRFPNVLSHHVQNAAKWLVALIWRRLVWDYFWKFRLVWEKIWCWK